MTCWRPLTLDEALDRRQRELGRPWWQPEWLTLVEDPTGSAHRISADVGGATTGLTLTYWPGQDPTRPLPGTLTDVVGGWLTAFERGLHWDNVAEQWAYGDPADRSRNQHELKMLGDTYGLF